MIQKLRERLEADTAGYAIFALVILSLLYFFDEFDTAAFGVLAPDIEKAFHLTDQKYGVLVVLNVSVLLLLAIPVGYLADRVRRTRLVVISGVIAGLFSFGTGIAGSIGILTLMRFGNGVGLLGNIPVHNSLLADYYPVESRPRVFGDHANAVQLGAIIGPIFAGVLGSAFGWRAPFLILMIPILVATYYTTKLKEPARGATDDPEGAALLGADDRVRFREGVRVLWAVRTLRRQFIGSLFFGAGTVPLAFLLPLYLDRVYHIGPAGRGVIGAINAAATFYGVQRSGKWSQKWFAQDMGEPLKRSAYCLMAVGVGIALFAAAPWFVLAFAIGLVNAFIIGAFTPPFTAVQALVSPARARTMSFSFGALFLVVGVVFLFYGLGMGAVSDNHGIRWGVGILSPYWLIAGLILWSAAKFVREDAANGLRSLHAAIEARSGTDAEGSRALLVARGVDVAYDQTQVLFGVDLDVYEGEIVALLGTNGAGKSTLLKAISGLNPAVNGSIYFDGHDIARLDTGVIAHLGIAQVPGGRGIFPSLTVEDNIRAAGWMYRNDRDYLAEATKRVLEYFPILDTRWQTAAGSLSGGEQQMLSLAQAFIAKPRLLMIDELSLGLAPTIVDRLLEIVRAIHDNGTTVILVEQSVNVALRLAKRAVFMEKGEIRFSGPTAELLGRTDILRAVFLKGAASVTSSNGSSNGNGKSNGNGTKPAPKRNLDKTVNALLDNPIVLETRGLTKTYGGVTAVNDVALELHQGQILGLIGPNGAGKTSIFDLISGFQTPDRGFVALEGRDVTQWPAWRRAKAGLARGFQDARLWPSLTVREAIAAAVGSAVTSPLPAFMGLPAAKDAEIALALRVEEVIELLGLGAFRDKFISELSTGSRRIVEIAALLPNAPKVIILDEPSSGIAQKETEALGPMLKEVQRYLDCSILLIEHDMPLISSLADHMVALELGQVIAFGRPADVLENARVVESYLGNTSYSELARN